MSRAPAVLAAALALSSASCTKTPASAAGARFRQPSSIAVFRGKTVGAPTAVKPYVAVANQARNDVSILHAEDDTPVPAPVVLRTVVVAVENRPTLVAAASLGDGAAAGSVEDPKDPSTAQPDLLVAVSAGGSVLQLIETWDSANVVHSEPLTDPLAVDLGYDVLALAFVPSPPGTARLAAVLADHRVAVVTYERQRDGSGQTTGAVAPVRPPAISGALPFQPEAIAAMPGDPALTSLFVATRDPIATDASGNPIYGVEEISLSGLVPVRALGARAPTRLVAAARLGERTDPASAADDQNAFPGPPVLRVYAVLDESGCGPRKRIDCGVVSLDAGPAIPSGVEAIPHDDAFMPYRAPMRVPGRPLALSVSGPPVKPPPTVAGEPDFEGNAALAGYMRVYSGGVARATPAVAAVPSDDGRVYFLDLGRFEMATSSTLIETKPVVVPTPGWSKPCTDTANPECGGRRLWLEGADGAFVESSIAPATAVTVTPGFTPNQSWTVSFQGALSELSSRSAQAGDYVTSTERTPWIAVQVPVGGGPFNQVAHLWDPALGVRQGDIVTVKAPAVGAPCVGTTPLSPYDTVGEFEVEVVGLLAPAPAYPGGAATVRARADADASKTAAWATCFDQLLANVSGGRLQDGLVVTVLAGEYVLTGSMTGGPSFGYMGRPAQGVEFSLAYEDEDALAAACPLETWSWNAIATPPAPSCDPGSACRTSCERLAIVRKLRRVQGLSVSCSTIPDPAKRDTCVSAWQGNASTTPPPPDPQTVPPTVPSPVFPLVLSPVALGFTFGVQPESTTGGTASPTARRGMTLTLTTSGPVLLQADRKSNATYQASDIVSFDRSVWDALAGYRFLVSYPADFVLDTSSGQAGAPSTVIR